MITKFLGKISFQDSYVLQKELLKKRINNEIDDIVLGLAHFPCVTVGRSGSGEDIKQGINIPVYFIERGGKATYHGEGQLVCYFIWNIKKYGIRDFLDLLEGVIALTLGKLGVDKNDISMNLKGRGVWIKNKKIASIGIAIKKWVSFHGISINLDKGIQKGFNLISPCGMDSSEMGSLEDFGVKAPAEQVFEILVNSLKRVRLEENLISLESDNIRT